MTFDVVSAFALLAQAEELWVKLQAEYAVIRAAKFNTPEERAAALQTVADLVNLYNDTAAKAKAAFAAINGHVQAGDIEAALANDSQVPAGWNPPPTPAAAPPYDAVQSGPVPTSEALKLAPYSFATGTHIYTAGGYWMGRDPQSGDAPPLTGAPGGAAWELAGVLP